MLKKILLLLGMVLILLSGTPIIGSAETDHKSSENTDLSTLQFKRIAVMPFSKINISLSSFELSNVHFTYLQD